MFSHSFYMSPLLCLSLSQLRISKQCWGRTSIWALWTGPPLWRKKNSQRISGLMWVCMQERMGSCGKGCSWTKESSWDKWVSWDCWGCLPGLIEKWGSIMCLKQQLSVWSFKDTAHCCLVTHYNMSLLQFKWSRKGFMRTRWIIHNQYVTST